MFGRGLVGLGAGVGGGTGGAEMPAGVGFRPSDAAASAGAFIDGLLSGISRKTGWQMAEQAGLNRALHNER